MPLPAWESEHQRIVADTRIGCAPCRHIGYGVGETHGCHTTVTGLVAIGRRTQPVVGIAQRHKANTMCTRQLHCASHADTRVGDAQAQTPVVILDRAEAADAHRRHARLDNALVDVAHQTRKAIDAMGVNALQRIAGHFISHLIRLFLRAAVSLEHLREGGFYLVKMQSHRLSSRRINVIKLSSCSSNETPPVSGALFSHSRQ